MGPPFKSRLYKQNTTRGLQFPPSLRGFPFICELCTVRAHLHRELDSMRVSDIQLLALERARLIDMAHGWATSTLDRYTRLLRNHLKFREQFDLPLLPFPVLPHPPVDENIILYWNIEYYTTKLSRRSKDGTPRFNTARQYRSAYSSFSAWCAALCLPHNTFRDDKRRLLTLPTVGPSDTVSASMISHGMSVRLGTHSTPSMALHHDQVHRNQELRALALQNTSPTSLHRRYLLICAQCIELVGWLCWLRSSECFGLQRRHIEIVEPKNHAIYNFPPNVGAILFHLLDPTKTNQTDSPDIVIAYTTSSGLQPGKWFTLLFKYLDHFKWTSPFDFLFQQKHGKQWTSHFYRHEYLFPYLQAQRDEGDVYLRVCDGSPGNTFADKFYSFHSYRIGGGNHCNRHRKGCFRKALPSEKIQHGRWRVKNQGKEDMPTHYTQPAIEELIWLTLLAF